MRIRDTRNLDLESADRDDAFDPPSKIRKLLSRFPGGNPGTGASFGALTLARGIGLLMVSALLAAGSVDATRKTSIIEFRSSHPLPSLAWRSLLREAGFKRITDPAKLAPLFKSGFPFPEDALRIHSRHSAILLPPEGAGEGATLWMRDEAPPASDGEWLAWPFSLEGFEKLAELAKETPPSVPAVQSVAATPRAPAPRAREPRRSPKWIDPKAFHY
ncbi:MAG: hypothetical protein EBX52_03600 [Proteobacteria bacterium]|nr:hypothetical protein [Pseudomonadota bacterium]